LASDAHGGKDVRWPVWASLGALGGALYLILALLVLADHANLFPFYIPPPLVRSDLITPAVLFMIGGVLIYGGIRHNSDPELAHAYIWVGSMLSVMVLVVRTLVISAEAVEAHILLEDGFEGWTAAGEIGPAVYLSVVPIINIISNRSLFTIWRMFE